MPDNNLFYRSIDLDRSGLDEKSRTIDISISSETPVNRWFGKEILMHSADSVDLSRSNSVLFNHDPNRIVGVISNVRIERKKGKATIGFDDDEDGNKAMQKVKSGSLRGASIGYTVESFRELKEGESWRGYEGPAYIATRWTPYEASLTPIPADPSVGIGRSITRSLDGIQIEKSSQNEDIEMDEIRIREMIQKELAQSNSGGWKYTPDQVQDLVSRASAAGGAELELAVYRMITEGQEESAVLRKILDGHGPADAGKIRYAGGDGTGRTAGLTLASIPDDLLARSIMGAGTGPGFIDLSSLTEGSRDVQPRNQPIQSSTRSLASIDDDLLARSLANPYVVGIQ